MKTAVPLNGTDVYSEAANQSLFAITNYTYYQEGENGYTIKGLVKSVTDPEGRPTTYTYDSFGNVETVTNGLNETTTYTYNAAGFNTSTETPKGELTSTTDNNNGQMEKTVLDNGETLRIIYNAIERKVQEITPNLYNSAMDDLANHTLKDSVGTRYAYYPNGTIGGGYRRGE